MNTRRVGELDLLRFLAAISVVMFHYTFRGYVADDLSGMPYPLLAPVAQYGFLGVELFFMISGFVILMTASRGSLKHFAISRIARLYPVFWVCCTLTFIATLSMGGERFSASPAQYLVNLTMLSGFVKVPSIDGVYWSLFVELKFYFLVALVLLFRQLERTQLLLALWLGASIFLSIFPVKVLHLVLVADFAPLFVAGAVCYLIYARGVSTPRLIILGTAWGAALQHALADIPDFERTYRTDLDGYVVAGTISAMFVVFLLIALNRTGVLARTNWVALGALTYPLYLIHQNVGYMLFNAAYPTLNRHVLLWGTLLLMLAAAYLIDRLVEQRYSGRFRNALEVALNSQRARPVPTYGRPLAKRVSHERYRMDQQRLRRAVKSGPTPLITAKEPSAKRSRSAREKDHHAQRRP